MSAPYESSPTTTIAVTIADKVATVRLNRPERFNAFNEAMQDELSAFWRHAADSDDIAAVVLTAEGDKAFCTGIDRDEVPTDPSEYTFDPIGWSDPGMKLGPKSNECWKPTIAAVNGIACGGAFYLLGESDVIIAAEHATFFDPHLTYGMAAIMEPTLMAPRMPFGEIMRMSLLGNHERMSAQRALTIGLISEITSLDELVPTAQWIASAVAEAPTGAVQATVRNLWMAKELSLKQALDMGGMFLHAGTTVENLQAGQELFASGRRITPRVR